MNIGTIRKIESRYNERAGRASRIASLSLAHGDLIGYAKASDASQKFRALAADYGRLADYRR